MMEEKNILVIAYAMPEPDKASGDLRLFTVLEMLCGFARVSMVLRDISAWRSVTKDYQRYERLLTDAGVEIMVDGVYAALVAKRYEMVFFEFYHPAAEFGKLVRYLQPDARQVIDSVDVHFNRLASKARLTGNANDIAEADAIRTAELSTYHDADLVVVVSEDDRQLIHGALTDRAITVLPNVHELHDRPEQESREYGRMVFVGSFRHTPNIDAMLYFVGEVMPIIREQVPNARLSIIGSHPPSEIIALAAADIDVLGYVPDTKPYLQSAYISIAPLRYGGGLKGKVGEAMSHGLPVITTSFGAEGFGLIPDQHLLVADSNIMFADAVVRVLADKRLHESLSQAGHQFIAEHYSRGAMELRIAEFLNQAKEIRPAKVSLASRLAYKSRKFYDRHFGWRRVR